jgi:F-type H+-transporting ATPase subunit alpha
LIAIPTFRIINIYQINLYVLSSRISLRGKVNDSLITGILIIDSCLSIGKGQRQLILGDRYTGKTSIYSSTILSTNIISNITIYGIGASRLYTIYIAINIQLNKLLKIYNIMTDKNNNNINIYNHPLILATQSSTNSLLSFISPILGITIAEVLRSIGIDSIICFDDLMKHAKAYRQISLLSSIIPSRDAFSSNIFNIHASLLERSGKLSTKYVSSSITAFPIIETINSNITEFISTNVISITDGQLYLNKILFLSSIKPAIDTALSVSRIGSSSQSKIMKLLTIGLKNEITTLRIQSELNKIDEQRLLYISNITYQNHLFIYAINITALLLLALKSGIIIHNINVIYLLLYYLSSTLYYLSYIIFISINNYNIILYNLYFKCT